MRRSSVLLPLLLVAMIVAAPELRAEAEVLGSAASMSAGSDRTGCAARRLDRVSGPSRLTTATAVAANGWSSSDEVVLASADAFPDALSGAVLAALRGAPTLLTPGEHLPSEVVEEIERLDPSRVWVLGGPAAISEAVERAVESTSGRPETVRLSGGDRYATAAAIARQGRSSPVAAVASGERFPDALAAGALAATPRRIPTLLTPGDRLHEATYDALRDLDVETVYVIGGEVAVGRHVDEVLRDAGFEVRRLAGPDRYATSATVAERARAALADGLRGVVFATGSAFPDALTAAALAARTGGLVTLVPPAGSELPAALAGLLDADRDHLDCNALVGGPAAVAADTADGLAAHLRVHPPDAPRPSGGDCDVVIHARTDGADQTRTIQQQIDTAPDGTAGDPTTLCLPVGRTAGRYRVDGTLEVRDRTWLEIRGPSPGDHATIYSDVDGITAGNLTHTGRSNRRHWKVVGSRHITLRNLRVEGPFYPENERYDGPTRRENNFGEPGYAYYHTDFEGEHAFELSGSHDVAIVDTSSKDVGGDHLSAAGRGGDDPGGSTDIRLVRAHADHPHRHGTAPVHVFRMLIDGLTVTKGGYAYVDFEPGGDTQRVSDVEIRNGEASVALVAFVATGAGQVNDVYLHHNVVHSATPTWGFVHVESTGTAEHGRRRNWTANDNRADGYEIGSCSTAGSGVSPGATFVDVDNVEVRRNRVRVKPGWSCNALAHFHDVGGDVWLTDNVVVGACTEYRWFVDDRDRTGTTSDYFVQNPERRADNETTGTGCRS